MFYLNHNDIEGLFRDAAENYQMSTDKAFDWNKINNAIHKNNNNNKPPKNNNNRRNLILLLLLLIATGLGTYYISSLQFEKKLLQNNTALKNNSSNSQHESEPGAIEESKANGIHNADKLSSTNTNAAKENTAFSSSLHNSSTAFNRKNDNQFTAGINNSIIKSFGAEKKENMMTNVPKSFLQITPDDQPDNKKEIPEINKLASDSATQATFSSINQLKNSSSRKKSTSSKGGGFYTGALVAPDITFIEFQKTNGVGITLGLTVGYRLNKKWSVETGLLLDRKNYYTKGEYFDKSNIPNLYNVELVSVNGTCNMLEMPLNVRYKFNSNNPHQNFSASVGTSTYFMTKEDYDYTAVSNGWNVNGSLTSYPSSTHLFAVINFGAGYERNISNTVSMRIEPYFKVPVKGIGTGNLYMSSTGINIGVTKYFGKK